MFERITSVVADGNRRFPLRYRRMINSVADRFSYLRSLYLFGKPMQTPGTEFLRFFILNLNVTQLDEYNSDVERYTEVIKFFKNSYLNNFDPVYSGSIKGGKFISMQKAGGLPPPEIFLNVDCSEPLTTLPFEKPWSDWQNLRGLKLVYHDSAEIIERFTNSVFEFNHQKPTFMVFTLDMSILLFKYYKYWKDCFELGVPANVNEFIKQYEYANLFDDLLDVWTLNLLTMVFKNPDVLPAQILKSVYVPQRVATDSMLLQGIEGIREFITLVKQGQVRPQDFLETRWFLNCSINEKLQEIDKWDCVPMRRQYLWCEAVLWLPYLDLLYSLVDSFPEGAFSQLITVRGRDIWNKRLKYAKMPGIARGEILQNYITGVQKRLELRLNK